MAFAEFSRPLTKKIDGKKNQTERQKTLADTANPFTGQELEANDAEQ